MSPTDVDGYVGLNGELIVTWTVGVHTEQNLPKFFLCGKNAQPN